MARSGRPHGTAGRRNGAAHGSTGHRARATLRVRTGCFITTCFINLPPCVRLVFPHLSFRKISIKRRSNRMADSEKLRLRDSEAQLKVGAEPAA